MSTGGFDFRRFRIELGIQIKRQGEMKFRKSLLEKDNKQRGHPSPIHHRHQGRRPGIRSSWLEWSPWPFVDLVAGSVLNFLLEVMIFLWHVFHLFQHQQQVILIQRRLPRHFQSRRNCPSIIRLERTQSGYNNAYQHCVVQLPSRVMYNLIIIK